ncbi:hypothetical protein ACFL1E_07920 [Candidatus Omnitrophota bacterium]
MHLERSIRRAQSMVEYCILLAVILSALLLLQAIVKRGFSGGLNEAAERMGEQYSPTATAERTVRKMLNDQVINEEITATTCGDDEPCIENFWDAGATGYTPVYAGDKGAYTFTARPSQKFSVSNERVTDSASQELYRWDDFQRTDYGDFDAPFSAP